MLAKVYAWRLDRADIEARIEAIDAEGDGGLRERLKAQREFLKTKEAELASIEGRTHKYEKIVFAGERDLNGNDSVEGSNWTLKLARKSYEEERRLFPYREGAAAYRERMRGLRDPNKSPGLLAADAVRAAASVHRKLRQAAIEASGDAEQDNRQAELKAPRCPATLQRA